MWITPKKHMCFEEIELCAQHLLIVIGLIVNMNEGGTHMIVNNKEDVQSDNEQDIDLCCTLCLHREFSST